MKKEKEKKPEIQKETPKKNKTIKKENESLEKEKQEDENHMKMMLSTLEKPYKQYLTFNKEADAFKAISFMYFNNHENKQFQIAQEELGVDEKTIHRMLDFGYVRLQRIVKSRF